MPRKTRGKRRPRREQHVEAVEKISEHASTHTPRASDSASPLERIPLPIPEFQSKGRQWVTLSRGTGNAAYTTEIAFNTDVDILHVHSHLSGSPLQPGQRLHDVSSKLASLTAILTDQQLRSVKHIAFSCLPTNRRMGSKRERQSVEAELEKFKNLSSIRPVVLYLPEAVAGKYKNRKAIGLAVKNLFEHFVREISAKRKNGLEWKRPYVQACIREMALQDVDDEAEVPGNSTVEDEQKAYMTTVSEDEEQLSVNKETEGQENV
ncbi:hypothetical protein BU16DRAFT_558186 [Lophium mytilinum]|uniref:Uncharacterized protein n=1 Tax=Lophium mytilinum TaxID=390894 RepID=A0A6A6R8X7_9PEZI|nr:hypothetical protein BU16DRAFT_558186 [Lophium mytilinum]